MNDPIERLKKYKQLEAKEVILYTERELIEEFTRFCKKNKVSRSALITELIRDYLEGKGKSLCIPSTEKNS